MKRWGIVLAAMAFCGIFVCSFGASALIIWLAGTSEPKQAISPSIPRAGTTPVPAATDRGPTSPEASATAPVHTDSSRPAPDNPSLPAATLLLFADIRIENALLRTDAFQAELRRREIELQPAAKPQQAYDAELGAAVLSVDPFTRPPQPYQASMPVASSDGTEAIVAHNSIRDLSDLLKQDGSLAVAPKDPGGGLLRALRHDLDLETNLITMRDSAAVLKSLQQGDRSVKRAYLLREPYLSEALAIFGIRRLLDASATIGDRVELRFSKKADPRHVKAVQAAYQSAVETYKDRGPELLLADWQRTHNKVLSYDQAFTASQRISWGPLAPVSHPLLAPSETSNISWFGPVKHPLDTFPQDLQRLANRLHYWSRSYVQLSNRAHAAALRKAGIDPNRILGPNEETRRTAQDAIYLGILKPEPQ